MRVSILALTAGACLLAAGTVIAEPGRARPGELELCHDYVRTSQAGSGSLQAGTTFASLVESAGCEGVSGRDCVVRYCYGGDAPQSAAVTQGERLSER
jgi:hypothetical protein